MKVCIGIDQSYKRTGIAVSVKQGIKYHSSIALGDYTCHTEQRKALSRALFLLIKKTCLNLNVEPNSIIIVVERIRLRSQGFLNVQYIQSTSALISTIIDTAYDFNIPVYSVDTRAWKSAVVGTSKGESIEKIITRGKNKGKTKKVLDNKKITLDFVKKRFKIDCEGNDDEADAICISRFPFCMKSPKLLRREK